MSSCAVTTTQPRVAAADLPDAMVAAATRPAAIHAVLVRCLSDFARIERAGTTFEAFHGNVLWPAPKRGERVRLACGCAATVMLPMPIVFIYRVAIDDAAPDCRHSHRHGGKCFVRLERLKSRA